MFSKKSKKVKPDLLDSHTKHPFNATRFLAPMRLPRPRKALTSHAAKIREDSVADPDIPPEGSNFICSSVLYLTSIFRWKDTEVYSQTGWGRAMAGCAPLDPPLERFID